MAKYNDMKRAEMEAINAFKKARDRAIAGTAACAIGMCVAQAAGTAACVAAVAAVIDALNDAKAKNDLFGFAIQQYQAEKQTLLDCIDLASITIQPGP
jgi:hypothetical protein